MVVLITGMSGAGRTSALKALEDLGYEAVDNIPLSLLPGLVAPQPEFADDRPRRPLAVGADVRTREFSAESFLQHLGRIAVSGPVDVRMVFLECDDDELRRRYAETRHRHPLAGDRPVSDGINLERRLLAGLRERADLVVDTTGIGPGELKRILQAQYGLDSGGDLSIFVTSFSFARGLPRAADLVFDVRFLRNPHYVPELRPHTGRDPAVASYVREDPGYAAFFAGVTGLLKPLLPRYVAEGKSYLTIAVGCTGGRHRSVFTAEELASWLTAQGEHVHVSHRDMDRAAA
jgi:UPF0042 nucleotide-binding protein